MALSFRVPRFLRADRVARPYGGTSWTPSPTGGYWRRLRRDDAGIAPREPDPTKKHPRSHRLRGCVCFCYWMEMELLLGSCFFAFLGTETVRMPSSNLAETSSGSTASPT